MEAKPKWDVCEIMCSLSLLKYRPPLLFLSVSIRRETVLVYTHTHTHAHIYMYMDFFFGKSSNGFVLIPLRIQKKSTRNKWGDRPTETSS